MARDTFALIVGAGIAGLGLGSALRRSNVEFQLVDRRPSPPTRGVGVFLPGNAMRALEALGLADETIAAGRVVHAIDFTDDAGHELFQMELCRKPSWGNFISLRHAQLHRILLASVSPEEVRWGDCIEDLRETEHGVHVRWNDGSTSKHAVVIGADGVHSDLRRRILSTQDTVLHGFVGWRFLTQCPPELERPLYMLGNGCTLVMHPLRSGELYGGAGPVADQLVRGQGELDRLNSVFAGFGGMARQVLADLGPLTTILPTKYHHVNLERWHTSRCVLIGDAAHACAPTLSQGTAMAIEDGLVLAEHLTREPVVSRALDSFEERRRPRVSNVGDKSLERLQANRPMNSHQAGIRNSLLRGIGAAHLAAAWDPLMSEPY